MFPFLVKESRTQEFMDIMLDEGFEFFKLKETSQEDKFYGKHPVHHRKLEKFFLPNIEQLLFPEKMDQEKDIRRFSKALKCNGKLQGTYISVPFEIPSIDIVLCPFQVGILTIRVQLPEGITYSDSIEFADIFRTIEPIEKQDAGKIIYNHHEFGQVKDFIFEELCPFIKQFMDNQDEQSPYFGSMPFFMDEKMYAISYVSLDTVSEIDHGMLYRIGHMYGYDEGGGTRNVPSNPAFLEQYYNDFVYDAWADDTYYGVTDYTFFCLTKTKDDAVSDMITSEMYGKHYYSFLLYFFYKIVLMKLMHIQSDASISRDEEKIEELIVDITGFSSNYYFPEVNNSTFGKGTFRMVKNVFQIEHLMDHLMTTLETLYQNHERLTSKRSNNLLQVLTIYSVISGIFGMNLVVEDIKDGWKWSEISHFSVFEFFGLFVSITAIVIGTSMGYYFVKQYIHEHRKRKKYG